MKKDKVHLDWYPGHIEKAVRLLKEKLNLVDVIIELRWFFPNNGWHKTLIYGTETVEEVWNSIPHNYGI